MKILLAAFAITAFAAGATADDVYHGLAEGNPDLNRDRVTASVVAIQPGVGESVNRYHGLDEGNSDLFTTRKAEGAWSSSERPDIYSGFRDPNLTY